MGLFSSKSSNKQFITQEDRRVAAQDQALVLSEGATLTTEDRSVTNINTTDPELIDSTFGRILGFAEKQTQATTDLLGGALDVVRSTNDDLFGTTGDALQAADVASERVLQAQSGTAGANKLLIAIMVIAGIAAAALVLPRFAR